MRLYTACYHHYFNGKNRASYSNTGIKEVAIAGGVSANSGLRKTLLSLEKKGCKIYIPPFEYCTDNAAMIAITGYYKYLNGEFSKQDITAQARLQI